MSILNFFVRAMAVIPDELSRYITQDRDIKTSITPNRGAVCSKKTMVKISGDIKLAPRENMIQSVVNSPVAKAPVTDDGPII